MRLGNKTVYFKNKLHTLISWELTTFTKIQHASYYESSPDVIHWISELIMRDQQRLAYQNLNFIFFF